MAAVELDSMQVTILLEALNRLEGKLDNLSDRIQTMENTMTGQIASLSEKVASLQKEKEQLFKFHNESHDTVSRAFDEIKDVVNMSENNARAMTLLQDRMGAMEVKDDLALKREVDLREAERRGAWGLPAKLAGLVTSLTIIIGLITWLIGE